MSMDELNNHCVPRNRGWQVPYFAGGNLEDEFLASAAMQLTTTVYCRSEFISVESLSVIERGIAAKDGRIATKGTCLGDDMVLSSSTFRDLNPAIALTFVVQVAMLKRKSLEALLEDYPLARAKIRRATYKLAFRRAVTQVSKVIRGERRQGVDISISEAFAQLRRVKEASTALTEPIKPVMRLSEEVTLLREGQEALRARVDKQLEALASRIDRQSSALSGRLDAVLAALTAIEPKMSTTAPNAARCRGTGRSGSTERPPARRKQYASTTASTCSTGSSATTCGSGSRRQGSLPQGPPQGPRGFPANYDSYSGAPASAMEQSTASHASVAGKIDDLGA